MLKVHKISNTAMLSSLALIISVLIYFGFNCFLHLFHYGLTKVAFPIFNYGQLPTAIISISIIYCITLIVFFVKPVPKFKFIDYFSLNKINGKQLLLWSTIAIIFEAIGSYIFSKLNLPLVSWWIPSLNPSSHSFIVWIISAVILAPILEELLFRGVLFTVIARSALGPYLAILLTAYLWTVPLAANNIYSTLLIFLLGVLLGIARMKTNSVITSIIMHALNNIFDVVFLIIIFVH